MMNISNSEYPVRIYAKTIKGEKNSYNVYNTSTSYKTKDGDIHRAYIACKFSEDAQKQLKNCTVKKDDNNNRYVEVDIKGVISVEKGFEHKGNKFPAKVAYYITDVKDSEVKPNKNADEPPF